MTASEASTYRIDCRGQHCPAPIMATAKAARTLKARGGGVIEIAADDAAFPLDLRSWCTSSKAELVSLQTSGEQHLAVVRIIGVDGGLSTAPPRANPVPEPSANVAPHTESLDCRGMQCPQPILTLSRLAKSLPVGTEVEVVADDDAFQLDVASWCRTSGATLVSIERHGAEFHARVRVAGSRRRGTPAMAAPTPQIVTDPVAPPPPSSSSSMRMTSILELRLDGPPSGWTARLDEVARGAGAGQRLRVIADSAELSREIVQWCAARGHALLGLDTRGPVAAELELREPPPLVVTPPMTALAVREPEAVAVSANANRCTLLVLHNDQEALLAALLVAVGAASQGREVVMFFTFWGLNLLRGDAPNPNAPAQKVSWMQRMLKWMMPKGPNRQALGKLNFGGMGKQMLNMIMKQNNIMSLQQLLESAEEQGIRFIACTMSMQVMGITKRDLQPRTNLEYGGVAAFVEAAHGSGMSLVF